MKKRRFKEKIAYLVLLSIAFLLMFILAFIFYFIFSRGISVISWEFLSQMPKKAMTAGGMPQIKK